MSTLLTPETSAELEKAIMKAFDEIIRNAMPYPYALAEIDCNHDWQTYQGFSESYIYCTKCDMKAGGTEK